VGFLVREGELDSRRNVCIADKNIQGEKGDLAHYQYGVTVISRPAAVIDDLEPAWSRIIVRHETRGPVNRHLVPESDLAHVHLMVPRVPSIRPFDEPRVKCEPFSCWDVACGHIVVPFARPVPLL
jgi:hypothetical protein